MATVMVNYSYFITSDGLDKVISKARIVFPEQLSVEKVESLFRYLAQTLNADVTYEVSQHRGYIHKQGQVVKDLEMIFHQFSDWWRQFLVV